MPNPSLSDASLVFVMRVDIMVLILIISEKMGDRGAKQHPHDNLTKSDMARI